MREIRNPGALGQLLQTGTSRALNQLSHEFAPSAFQTLLWHCAVQDFMALRSRESRVGPKLSPQHVR
jgi:hypothetical protein